jgi:ATP-dependent DNA ligase
MNLPIAPPILPMLAQRVDALPPGDGWIFEPKWDGFRTLVFRDGAEILLQSRDTKALNRYFPELLGPLLAGLPDRCVLDGELVVARSGRLEFESLQLRIHPAASRVALLAREIPASMVFFDLLCLDARDLRAVSFGERRALLEATLAGAERPLHLTPATADRAVAGDWFRRFEGAGLDGVIAKAAAGTYQPNKRVMLKIKHERDCDCVVAGFRWHKGGKGEAVGSLLLGLHDAAGVLQHVGVAASFTAAARRALVEQLAPYRANALEGHPWRAWAEADAGATVDVDADAEGSSPPQDAGAAIQPTEESAPQRRPGVRSRWSQGKDLSWEPLRPELVVEVAYEHMQGTRFRHLAHFRRWRPDKPAAACTYGQLEAVPPQELSEIFR